MALFRRKNTEQTVEVPPEIQDYYQSVKRERSGVAWLLALATLGLTLLLTVGLFYGGRWGYRKIVNRGDKPDTTIVQEGSRPDGNSADKDKPAASGNPQTSSTNTTTPSTPPPTPPASTPAPTATNPSTPGATTTPRPNTAGTNSADLPTTGPADTAAVFTITLFAGYMAHRYVYASSRR